MSRRTERVGNLIRETISELIFKKLADPRIDPAVTSVTRVDVPEDLLTAKVYVSILGAEARQRSGIRALRHASGYLQEQMTRRIKLRHTPVLEFVLDTQFKKTLETLAIIDRAMAEIRRQSPADGQAEPDAADEEE